MPNLTTTEAVPRCKCGGVIELSHKPSYDGHILAECEKCKAKYGFTQYTYGRDRRTVTYDQRTI